jgi:hypothetical protein
MRRLFVTTNISDSIFAVPLVNYLEKLNNEVLLVIKGRKYCSFREQRYEISTLGKIPTFPIAVCDIQAIEYTYI